MLLLCRQTLRDSVARKENQIKTVIAGIGFFLTIIGASCDIDKSDMRAVAAAVLVGCFLMWIGGKNYESEAEAEEKENRVYQELDDCCSSGSIGGIYIYPLSENERNSKNRM